MVISHEYCYGQIREVLKEEILIDNEILSDVTVSEPHDKVTYQVKHKNGSQGHASLKIPWRYCQCCGNDLGEEPNKENLNLLIKEFKNRNNTNTPQEKISNFGNIFSVLKENIKKDKKPIDYKKFHRNLRGFLYGLFSGKDNKLELLKVTSMAVNNGYSILLKYNNYNDTDFAMFSIFMDVMGEVISVKYWFKDNKPAMCVTIPNNHNKKEHKRILNSVVASVDGSNKTVKASTLFNYFMQCRGKLKSNNERIYLEKDIVNSMVVTKIITEQPCVKKVKSFLVEPPRVEPITKKEGEQPKVVGNIPTHTGKTKICRGKVEQHLEDSHYTMFVNKKKVTTIDNPYDNSKGSPKSELLTKVLEKNHNPIFITLDRGVENFIMKNSKESLNLLNDDIQCSYSCENIKGIKKDFIKGEMCTMYNLMTNKEFKLDSNEKIGTLKSENLIRVIESGFKPIYVTYYGGEETFIFKTKKEANKAFNKLECKPLADEKILGWWYASKDFYDLVLKNKKERKKLTHLYRINYE